ncbi:MAG: hypothetical protein ACK4IS_01440 [Erythrobacter sp.]
MSLRISSILAASSLWLAGCAPAGGGLPGEAVDCALGADRRFAPICTIERELEPGRFVLHHPGGSFRRIAFDPELLIVTAADGAERVTGLAQEDEYLTFALGEASYRMPLGLLADQP